MRILAITNDASLEVALSSLPGNWEITSARDPQAVVESACHCDVALIALGTTDRGLSAFEDLKRLGVGIACLVIGDGPAPQDAETTILIRPFAMRELVDALRETLNRKPAAAPPSIVEPVLIEEPIVQEEAPPIPEPEPNPIEISEWAASLLNELAEIDQPVVEEAPKRVLPAGVAPLHEATAARIVRHAAAAPSSSGWSPESRHGLHRLRKRRKQSSSSGLSGGERASMLRRVRNALDGARELTALIEDIPALMHPEEIAIGLVRETVDLLGAESAALLVPSWSVAASSGLTPAERAIKIPSDQALLADVSSRLEAVLVAPVDLVRGLVVGIPGTSCEALMLAPLEVEGTCHGILLAGRESFTDEALERLWLLAEEAAPGVAAASLIARLRTADLPVAL
ncbi:MAG: hypothetical protein ACYDCC_07020 [Actinomycetota bacterium]